METISDIKKYASVHDVPIMQDDGIDFICDYIRNHDITRVLEIGTAIGYSAIQFARTKNDVHITTIEIDIDKFVKAKQNVKDLCLENKIELICADALDYELCGEFDLIFIDAAKAQYIKFFEKYKKNLSSNGVIISDNLLFHGMVYNLSLTHNYSTKKLVKKIQKYRKFLETNNEFNTEFYALGDGIAVSKRK